MKAFWWFEENLIAGMARPGFNGTPWFDLPYEQAVLMGWVGQHSSGDLPKAELFEHVESYCPKIAKFYDLDQNQSDEITRKLHTKEGLRSGFKKLSDITKIVKNFEVGDEHIHLELCGNRLDHEISFLKEKGFKKIVTLTEKHHNSEKLSDHFETHHFSIGDLTAPAFEQVVEMAEVVNRTKKDREPMAVHCLAGIGRTSTMLIASHLVLGEKLENLLPILSLRNPQYKLAGVQSEFLRSVAEKLKGKRI